MKTPLFILLQATGCLLYTSILNVLADAMKIVKMIAGKLNISVESEETAADEAEQVACYKDCLLYTSRCV